MGQRKGDERKIGIDLDMSKAAIAVAIRTDGRPSVKVCPGCLHPLERLSGQTVPYRPKRQPGRAISNDSKIDPNSPLLQLIQSRRDRTALVPPRKVQRSDAAGIRRGQTARCRTRRRRTYVRLQDGSGHPMAVKQVRIRTVAGHRRRQRMGKGHLPRAVLRG